MVKEIIDFTGLEFDKEARRVRVERPSSEGERERRHRQERPSLSRNLRNLFTSFLG